MRNGAGFRGGGRAQLPSLPVDDPLTSDQKGVYSAYTPFTFDHGWVDIACTDSMD